jgi:PAS domain S-box-containing protein
MNEMVLIERIAAARQRLSELSELHPDPAEREIQVEEVVRFFADFLDDVGTLAADSKRQKEDGYQDQSGFNILAETATDGILTVDHESTISYANPAAGEMFGYELSEMLGKNLTSLMPERFRVRHLSSLGKYVTTGQRHIDWRCVELLGLHKNGREFPIEVSFGEHIRSGKRFFTGIVRDVTDRKRAEEALRASERRLVDIVDHTTALIFIKDLELRYLLVNREYERLFDVRRDEVRGKTDFDIHPHDVAETLRANDRQVIEAGGPAQFEEVVPSKGSTRHYIVVKFLLRDQANEPYAICGIATDITALKQTEELQIRHARQAALRADIHAAFSGGADSSLQTILQNSTEAIVRHLGAALARIWTLNEQGNILELQASAGQYTRLDGTHARVPVGELKIGLIAKERKPHLTNDVLHDQHISDPEWAKREGMVAFAGYPLLVEGHLVGVLAMFARDALSPETLEALASVADTVGQGIERKQAQEALRARDAELAHITRVMTMGEITSSIAHEINQPLGAIVNYGNAALRLLSTGSTSVTDIKPVLAAMVEDANRASAIIARIRALSKNTPPEMEALQVSDLFVEILPLVKHELARHQIALKTVFPEHLFPVRGDRVQLQQVLLNLMINGIEAMTQVPEDRRQLFIEAQAQVSEEESSIVVSVTDSGIGVKTDDLPRLFQAFHTTKPEGMGLGLAISRSIVEAHGGRLWASPNADLGLTFQFSLPVQT